MRKPGIKNDLYRILGVSPNASEKEIKSAYRRKAREMHPDLDPGNPWAEDEFKELSAAYQILSDATQRAKYDRGEIGPDGKRKRAGAKRASSPKTKTAGTGTSDFFSDGGVNIDGVDVSYVLTIDFLEAARGTKKTMKTTHGATLNVSVPPGTQDGQVLRLRGQGMRGFGTGKDGAALVEVNVTPHPIFRNEDRDVFTEEPVSLETAVLGGKLQVETIDGMVNVTVPPNSNTGTKLRLRGRGLAGGGRKDISRGDHYVSLIVNLPKKPDPALEELLRKQSGRSNSDDQG